MGFKINFLDIILIVLLVLNVAIFINGLNTSCDKCIITFSNDKISGVTGIFRAVKVPMDSLANSLENNQCVVILNSGTGYIYNE